MEQKPLADLIAAGDSRKQPNSLVFLHTTEANQGGSLIGCALGGALIAANLASAYLQQTRTKPRLDILVGELLGIEYKHVQAITHMYIDSQYISPILDYCRRHNLMANVNDTPSGKSA